MREGKRGREREGGGGREGEERIGRKGRERREYKSSLHSKRRQKWRVLTYFCMSIGFLNSFLGVGPSAALSPVRETVLLDSGVTDMAGRSGENTSSSQNQGETTHCHCTVLLNLQFFELSKRNDLIGRGSREHSPHATRACVREPRI